MTARIILLPDTDAALDRLNDARDIDRKMRDEARLHSNHTQKYRELHDAWVEAATDVVDELLEGAVYVDPEPDPRVAALRSYARWLEVMVDSDGPRFNRRTARATFSVVSIMEASDGE